MKENMDLSFIHLATTKSLILNFEKEVMILDASPNSWAANKQKTILRILILLKTPQLWLPTVLLKQQRKVLLTHKIWVNSHVLANPPSILMRRLGSKGIMTTYGSSLCSCLASKARKHNGRFQNKSFQSLFLSYQS